MRRAGLSRLSRRGRRLWLTQVCYSSYCPTHTAQHSWVLLLPSYYKQWWGYLFNSLFFWSFLTNSRSEDFLWLIIPRWKSRNKMTKPTSYHFLLQSITARLSLGSQVNFSFLSQSEYSWKPVNGLNPNIVKSLDAYKIYFANKKIFPVTSLGTKSNPNLRTWELLWVPVGYSSVSVWINSMYYSVDLISQKIKCKR